MTPLEMVQTFLLALATFALMGIDFNLSHIRNRKDRP